MAGSDPSSLLHSLMAGTSATTCMTAGMDEEMEEVQLFESEMIPIDEDAADGDEPAPDDLNLFLEGKITFKELARKMDEEDEIVPDEDDDDKEGKDTDDKELGGKKVNRKKRIRSGGRRSKLNEFNASLLGNAELYFARGKCEDAIAMVLQVVKENPLAHELYQTLGDFYDQLGEEDKALQYYHIAAYLCPHDGDSWRTVAEKHAEQGNFKESIACYDKAIRYIPAGKDNIACRMERSRLLEEEIKDLTKAIDGYESVLNLFTAEDEEFATDLAKKIARLHFDNRNGLAAVRTLETTFAKYEKSVEPETVNMYIELLISEKMIHKALLAFSKYCGVQIIDSETGAAVTESLDEDMITQMATRIAVNLIWPVPIDLLSKLVVCLIGLRAIHSVSQLQKQIEDESVETMGDLYLDVAEAYIEAGMHSAAEPFLHRLVQSSSYGNETAVWLRYARCLKEMGLDDRSIDAYFTVLSLQSDLCDARLELSHLLLTHNRSAEAVEVSSQIGSHILNLDLLLVRCNLLYEKKRFPEFVATAFSLLQCDMIYLKHERELTCMITSTTHRTRLESLRDVHKELKITPITNQRQDYTGREPSSEEYFSVFLRLCYVLAEKERDFDQLTRLVLSAYTSQSLSDRESSLDFIALMSLYKAQNSRFAYLLFKAIIGRDPANNQVWNVFCPIVCRLYQDLRHNRFCLRLFMKHPDLIPLAYFNGHNALMSGSYKHALAEYVNIHKQRPDDPFPVFCVCLAFVHLASQKYINSKNSLVFQLCAFLDKYLALRGECQESFFNAGRMLHQIGLLQNAVHFYKRALDCPVSVTDCSPDEQGIFDLRSEIAYNLSTIYKSSGSMELCLYYRKKYCVV